MSVGRPALLDVVHGLLERTYAMPRDLVEPARFVIGDAGYRRLYGDAAGATRVGSAGGDGARTLVRETTEGIRLAVYYPDAMIRTLEARPPQRGLDDDNVDAFAAFVEELDHLLCIAERWRERREVSLFELELHANVSKRLVLARFLAGSGRPLGERRRAWLRWHLFHKIRFADEDPSVRERYRDARRHAVRFLDGLPALTPAARIERLRRFHRAHAGGKLELIERS